MVLEHDFVEFNHAAFNQDLQREQQYNREEFSKNVRSNIPKMNPQQKSTGLPLHNLQLKVGSAITMLSNINQPRLCNSTRLTVKKLMNNVIETTILKGKYKCEDVLIPRIPMIPTDLPFDFKRLQFPVRLAFEMTINKAQGQSLQICGINLEYPCFSHGQLYVACSPVGKPSALFVYELDRQTKNIVYQKALQ